MAFDMEYTGYAYNWNNKRARRANVQELLDQEFANGDVILLYPNAVVSHLTALHSDHKPHTD